MRLPEEKPELVEAAPPGLSGTTWRHTDLSKFTEVPFTPINNPLTVKVKTPHYTCSSPLVKVPV
jgi:hypothetical protein